MKHSKIALLVFLGLMLAITGCKKASDQANLTSSTGFDSLSTTEDLTQIPQATTVSNQQTGVEILPVETSPVTQSVSSAQGITTTASGQTLTREQQIQTALKNAGFYNGAVDGKIGPASKRAIEAFQTSNGLKVDGKVGPQTWAALERYLNGPAQTTATTTVE